MPKRERVALVVEATDDDIPPMSIRLRHLLKLALRRCGLRVLWHQAADDWRFGQQLRQGEPLDLDAVTPKIGQQCGQDSAGEAISAPDGAQGVSAAFVDPAPS